MTFYDKIQMLKSDYGQAFTNKANILIAIAEASALDSFHQSYLFNGEQNGVHNIIQFFLNALTIEHGATFLFPTSYTWTPWENEIDLALLGLGTLYDGLDDKDLNKDTSPWLLDNGYSWVLSEVLLGTSYYAKLTAYYKEFEGLIATRQEGADDGFNMSMPRYWDNEITDWIAGCRVYTNLAWTKALLSHINTILTTDNIWSEVSIMTDTLQEIYDAIDLSAIESNIAYMESGFVKIESLGSASTVSGNGLSTAKTYLGQIIYLMGILRETILDNKTKMNLMRNFWIESRVDKTKGSKAVMESMKSLLPDMTTAITSAKTTLELLYTGKNQEFLPTPTVVASYYDPLMDKKLVKTKRNTIQWIGNGGATAYQIFRKKLTDVSWSDPEVQWSTPWKTITALDSAGMVLQYYTTSEIEDGDLWIYRVRCSNTTAGIGSLQSPFMTGIKTCNIVTGRLPTLITGGAKGIMSYVVGLGLYPIEGVDETSTQLTATFDKANAVVVIPSGLAVTL